MVLNMRVFWLYGTKGISQDTIRTVLNECFSFENATPLTLKGLFAYFCIIWLSIFWHSAYLMMVISEACRAYYTWYLCFDCCRSQCGIACMLD